MWCMQHLEKTDIEKLKEYCPCDTDRKRIMADIYGTQNSLLLEHGLADAENEEDFSVKLASLKLYGTTLHQDFTTGLKNGGQIFS